MKKNYHDDEYFEEDDDIDLVDLVFTLLRRWKLIVLTAVPVIILGVFFAMTRPNLYEAETTLIISNNATTGITLDSGDLSVNQKLVVTYSEIAKSRDVMSRVIKKYDLKENIKEMTKKINVTPVADTELIRLTYVDKDPKLAEAVTNELATEFIKKVGQVMRIRNINVVEKATEPVEPLPKKRVLIILASIVLGTMVGAGFVFAIELLYSKVRKPSDMEKILGVKMLGMIPEIPMEEEGEDSHESKK